jgi:O-antigen/teichoic acid export membrane protein
MWHALFDGIKKLATQMFGSQLRRNMTSGMLTAGINMLVILVSYPLYLHFLGYEKYGLWLILAVVLGFAQLGNLGINQAVMKLVAEEYGRENLQGIRSYVTMAWTVLTITGSIALLVILLFRSQIVAAFKLSGENAEMVSWLLPYIGALTIYVFLVQSLNAALAGLGRMDLSNYILSAGQFCAVLTSVLLLWLGHGIEGLLIGSTSSFVVVHVASVLFIRRKIKKLGFLQLYNWDFQRLKNLLHFGSMIFGGALMSILLDPFNKLMLSRYAGVATVPVYDISFRGSMQVRGLMEVGIRAIMPEVSRIGVNMTPQAHDRIASINKRATKFILFCGVPFFIILFAFAPVFLKLWLQKSYVDTLPAVFRFILTGAFLSLICVPSFYTLLGLGKARYCFFSSVIQGMINAVIIVTIVLVRGKISGYSVALSVMVAMGITSCYLLWKKHHVMKDKLLEIRNNNFAGSFENVTEPCRS